MSAFATLRSFVERRDAVEYCDVCGAPLLSRHQHLINPSSRRLLCSCDACTTLFPQRGETKYKRVPYTVRFLGDFRLSDAQWESLLIPIGLAFFLKSTTEERVLALYPSPAGSTESMLSLEAWQDIVSDNPVLAKMDSDVEALLVSRLGNPAEYYLCSIDRCYELVGLIRTHWHGLSGGEEMWTRIRQFFIELKEVAGA
jgi:Family of unknown function (DUF5947)